LNKKLQHQRKQEATSYQFNECAALNAAVQRIEQPNQQASRRIVIDEEQQYSTTRQPSAIVYQRANT
jgi:hypothetical protein